MAQVELKEVIKRFGSTQVVHGVNLAIEDNEFIVLVGPSGCGKSTILRMIAGLESISDGEICIDNKPISKMAPKDRNVAMVFQNYALYPHMNVFDNIAFSLKMAKETKDEIKRKVQEAAEILELTPYLHRKPAELSGGQRQRVAMGRAIVRRPSVFLFDEPLSNLDAQLRTQMRMELKKLHLKMQTTTIYVTHDQVEAMTLADKIVILKDGYIQQVGSPVDVFERPANKFVAGFIGNPPINILDGELSGSGGETRVKMGELTLPVPVVPDCATPRSVLVGIRPDAIKRGDAIHRFPEEWRIEVEVIVSEILGGQSLLEFSVGGINMIAELEGRVVARPGEKMELGFDLNRLLFFDPETEEVLK
ncbi:MULTISPECIES: ABC transporter ATP-binding protein [Desulfosediminicola]|uniref:ABC transporter ATP-binding protein n=1 Tax=Desulfosediminicola TaxID=2886823 RepID=UPI0010AC0A91|nr:sn-glycerol-3-phosphate ABC transporter ATP-binding protein UgpC [Desulfosediminicola ganghwensis]